MWDKIKFYRERYEKWIIPILLTIAVIIQLGPDTIAKFLGISSLSIIVFCAIIMMDDIISIKESLNRPNFNVLRNADDSNQFLIDYIKRNDPENIYIIGFSSWKIREIIESFLENESKTKIFILLQHPKIGAACDGQEERTMAQLNSSFFHHSKTKHYDNMKLLFYKQNASIRGVNIDNKLINMSWYFYKWENNKQFVFGHTNPTINVEESQDNFTLMRAQSQKAVKNVFSRIVFLN